MLKFIAIINSNTGHINSIMLPQAKFPAHNSAIDSNQIAIHINEVDMVQFHNGADTELSMIVTQYIYDMETKSFKRIGLPPHPRASWDPEIGGWALDADGIYSDIRGQRNMLLAGSDWTQMPDSPLTDEQKAAWATYRQELRDFPVGVDVTNVENMLNLVWPTPPAA